MACVKTKGYQNKDNLGSHIMYNFFLKLSKPYLSNTNQTVDSLCEPTPILMIFCIFTFLIYD